MTRNLSSIILAGGLSSRMGRFKPIMPLGRKTLLGHVISLHQSAGIDSILVVTGHRNTDTNHIAKQYGVNTIFNEQYKFGMFSSVLAGIRQLPESTHYFFIHPVDVPLVNLHTITKLIHTVRTRKVDVVYPIFDHKRGHPPLISVELKNKINKWNSGGGLSQCLQKYKKTFINVPVIDRGILMDVDTPEDYSRLILKFDKRHSLTQTECMLVMKKIINTPVKVIKHCQAVARIAVILATNINKTGKIKLDTNLINSAALIHDLAKTHANHAKVGATLLKQMGYTKMGSIVEQHMDLVVNKAEPLTESEIVYIADKLVYGNRLIGLETRFKKKISSMTKTKSLTVKYRPEKKMRIKSKIK